MLIALFLFALGSALCGAAQNMNMLIGARGMWNKDELPVLALTNILHTAVQGMGGGMILSLSSIILSDLVPLKERGVYNGLIGL